MLTLPNSSSKKDGGNGPHRHTSPPVELFGRYSSLNIIRLVIRVILGFVLNLSFPFIVAVHQACGSSVQRMRH